jgi:hypothetical protein
MSISFNLLKIDCALFCLDLIMDLIFVCYEVVAIMRNETYTQVGFFFDKFVYDGEVGFHINL